MSSIALAVIFISLNCVSLNWDWTPTNLLSSSSSTSNVLPPSNVRHDASPQLPSSFHWGSAASDDAFACQKFRSRQKQWRRRVGWRLETIGVTHPLWKISDYATDPAQKEPERLWGKGFVKEMSFKSGVKSWGSDRHVRFILLTVVLCWHCSYVLVIDLLSSAFTCILATQGPSHRVLIIITIIIVGVFRKKSLFSPCNKKLIYVWN